MSTPEVSSLFDLSGKHAVVTGGAAGLGRGIALGLALAGARVLVIDRQDGRDAVDGALSGLGAQAHYVAADLGQREQVSQAAAQAHALLDGRVDILVNNAGIQIRSAALDHAVEDWDAVLGVNLTAAFLLTRTIAAGMIERRSGKIVNLASIRSFVGSHGALAYGVSKGGIAQMTRSLSNEFAPHGVQVNAIAPGYMETDLTAGFSPESRLAALQRIPAGRWGLPQDVVGLAVFLSARASDYVTGTVIACDGGFLAA